MEILIISGLSGAGKSKAAAVLEDLDFYCVDNMPVTLIPVFTKFCLAAKGRYERVALVTDVRGQESFEELFKALDELQEMDCDYKILFVEASCETIIKRYKETRRRHPLDPEGRNLEKAVKREEQMLKPVRDRADYIVNTSDLTLGKLQRKLYKIFVGTGEGNNLHVTIMSFGFKYGIPIEADIVFDVRFLPNPFYDPNLRNLTGLDEPVTKYIFGNDTALEFMNHLENMMDFLLPNYVEEGKSSLVICIGCTGGHHRSVAITEKLFDFVSKKGYFASTVHRDIGKA